MLKSLTGLSLSDIDTQIQDYAVVLLSPHLRNRNALLAGFITSQETFLHTLSNLEITLPTFAAGLCADLRDFFPNFGSHTLQAVDATPTDLADTLAFDLKQLKSGLRVLILDDLDWITANDEFATFFEHLIAKFPHGMKLVINSRTLSDRPWGKLVRADKAIVLGEQSILNVGIFTASDKPQLEVYGFGTGHVYVNGLPIDTWDGPLPRNLFFFYIDHPMVTRDEIFETFWPGLGTKEATNVYHVTKRKVSERLGYEITSYSSGFYRPSDEFDLQYDVKSFENEVALGEEEHNESIDPLHRAIKLYGYEFLHSNNMSWISERRDQLRLTYTSALIRLGRIYQAHNETDMAIGFYLRALREVPEREDIHRDLMSIYSVRGEREKMIAQYKSLEENLKRTLGIAPSSATRALYNSLAS